MYLTHLSKVSEILNLLKNIKLDIKIREKFLEIQYFELNLFNTFRCYMDIKNHFPVKFTQHTDPRGSL